LSYRELLLELGVHPKAVPAVVEKVREAQQFRAHAEGTLHSNCGNMGEARQLQAHAESTPHSTRGNIGEAQHFQPHAENTVLSSRGNMQETIPMPASAHSECGSSVYHDEAGDDPENFWAIRASNIRRLFNLWDCNQLSNETFTMEIQNVLGDTVNISSSDSEFLRLTNKHRTARNLKFAALMSALRKDARSTLHRHLGRSDNSLSSYAGSYAGSVYEPTPSEAGSESMGAAGRPTSAVSMSSVPSSGRKHFMRSSNPIWGGPTLAACDETSSETPSGTAAWSSLRNLAEDKNMTPIQHYSESASNRCAVVVDTNFWAQNRPQPNQDDRSDTMSQSDVMSVADSQREVFTTRNRSGHGNILTWGNDSRSITPARKRTGRQPVLDSERGMPKSYMDSNIF